MNDNKKNIITCVHCGKQFEKDRYTRICSNCFGCIGCEQYQCPYCKNINELVKPGDKK